MVFQFQAVYFLPEAIRLFGETHPEVQITSYISMRVLLQLRSCHFLAEMQKMGVGL